jgi:2-polyprenyl-3-methyl-5-hydroxy-6-metoxy-1,4-benzoquinol methylase
VVDRSYQLDFASSHPAMYDPTGRQRKAETLVAVLRDALGERLSRARCLTVGCSTGIIDSFVAPHVGTMVGIDIDEAAIAHAQARHATSNLSFRLGDAMALDFAEESFDVVLCSQVYEHVPDPIQLMRNIDRVLAPGGICYFAATNKLCVIEQHYFLPFLSMLPAPLADRYLQLTGRGTHYYERHLTYWGLRKLTASFETVDYTYRLVAESSRFGTGYMVDGPGRSPLLRAWMRLAYWSFPGYVWLLRKR